MKNLNSAATMINFPPNVLRAMEESLVYFRFVILANDAKDELKSAYFHHDLSDMLLKGKHSVAIEMFRESGKSAYALRAFPLHCLCYPRKNQDYILLIKKNQDLASEKLTELIDEYKANPFLRHNFKEIKQENKRVFSVDVWTNNEKTEFINVRIEAYGKGGGIRGLSNQDRRPNVIILDDIQDKKDSSSETVIRSDWKWFTSDIMFLGKNARIFLIGNNLGENCVIERAIKYQKQLKLIGIRIPVMIDGKPTWAEKQSLEEIEAEKANYAEMGELDTWYAEKMCQAVSPETRVFKEEDYRYFDKDKSFEGNSIFAALDPASSNNPESCLRAIDVVSVDSNNDWFVREVHYGRWDSVQTLDIIFEVVQKYGLKQFGIEKGHYVQVLEPFLFKEMKKRNIFFDVVQLEHAKEGTKLERIKNLQPRFRAHSVHFLEDAEWLPEMKSELAGVTNTAIKSQYIDVVDALAMIVQMTNLDTEYLFNAKKIEACKNVQASSQSSFKDLSVMSLRVRGGKLIAKLVIAIDSHRFEDVETVELESFDEDVILGKIVSLNSRWEPNFVIGDADGLGLGICNTIEKTISKFVKFKGSESGQVENSGNKTSDGYLSLKGFTENEFLRITDIQTLAQLEQTKIIRKSGKVYIEHQEEAHSADVLMMAIYGFENCYYMFDDDDDCHYVAFDE